jgi:hypothetical protein
MTTAIERRLARLEREGREPSVVYVVLGSLPNEDDAPERELTPEEWLARHCGENCQ